MKWIKTILFWAGIACVWCGFQAQAATITDLRLAANAPGTVRLVAELSAETGVYVSRLTAPPRLVVDFDQSVFAPAVQKNVPAGTGFVRGLRTGAPKVGTARVVLDLPNQPLTEKHFLLKPQSGKGWRFVLDLTQNTSDSLPEIPTAIQTPRVGAGGLRPFNTPVRKKQRIIMLDPGHGGQDPGAISRSGHYEKNITLSMARETRDLLRAAGYKVVLTRDSDIFIPLRGRIKKAHDANADLFISIHADSAKNPSARGLSVYTISERASDAEAAALAERENKADILLTTDLSDIDPQAAPVLLDLAKTEVMNRSAQYAKCVVREMRKTVQLVPNAHRMAGFVVLKSPNIPSVLVELGYLSNKTEDRNLQRSAYRKKLAQALVRAVDDYFENLVE